MYILYYTYKGDHDICRLDAKNVEELKDKIIVLRDHPKVLQYSIEQDDIVIDSLEQFGVENTAKFVTQFDGYIE